MLTSKNITKIQVKKLLDLLEEYTRSDIAARLGAVPGDVFVNLTQMTVDKMDELRTLLYGTDDMVKLGLNFGIIKPRTKKKKKKKKKRIDRV